MRHRVNIVSHDRTIFARKNELLADKIQEAGINLSVYCNKKGLCGKCLVEILDGMLPPLSGREEFLLEHRKVKNNCRLSCRYEIKGDISIRIPSESIIKEALILTTGIESPVALDPQVKKYHLQLKKPEIQTPDSLLELFERYFQDWNLIIPLSLLKELQKTLERSKFTITAVLYKDHMIMDVEPGDTANRNFGIAIDVGTTTVVVEVVDLNTGETVDTLAAMNSQMDYGSDVVSRISFACSDPKNLNALRDSIVKTLNRMISRILEKNGIDSSQVYEIVLAGNTSMNHFFLGLPVQTLAVAPFNAVFTSFTELSSQELGLKINRNGKVYIVPNIKSFVGGDVSAGLAASGLADKKGIYLFIDLGTNGEIVLKTDKSLVATSTAAGPAFEGMNISCGSLALPGAIYKAEYTNRLKLTTIGNEPATGICGTGLIDLIAVFLKRGRIAANGKIIDQAKKIHITDKIFLTQKDVRELQLAAGAIKAGIRMILKEYHLKSEDLDGIFIAGAFGHYLNTKNSMTIGLLPEINEDKVIFIGNASLAGAKALLLSKQKRQEIISLTKRIHYFSLATNPFFQKYFVEAMELKNYALSDP